MEAFIQNVNPGLGELASERSLEGVLDQVSYFVGDSEFFTPEGIAYNLTLTNTGDAILLAGSVRAHIEAECARCLEPASFELEGDVEGYFLLSAPGEEEDLAEDEFALVGEDGSFDIAPNLNAALVYATPFVLYCKDDCKGLCPKCGTNLNEGDCACKSEISLDNPFAALADYKFD